MTDTSFTIGGEVIAVPPMTFKALKVALPAVKLIGEGTNIIDMTEQIIEILAAALLKTRPDLTADEIEERLTGAEMEGLVTQLPPLLQASGLIKTLPDKDGKPSKGEAKPSIPAISLTH